MKILKYLTVLLVLCSYPAYAKLVYKCKMPNGGILYQPTPCPPGTIGKEVLEIKQMTLEEIKAAEAKLRAHFEKMAAEDAAKAQEAKRRQMEIQKQQEMELERLRIATERKAAIEAERRRTWGPTFMPWYYRNQDGYLNNGN